MYQFRPHRVYFAASVKKFLIIAWICALLLIPLTYFTMTGKVAGDQEKTKVEQRVNLLEQSRTACVESLQKKSDNLTECIFNLQSCSSLLESKTLVLNNQTMPANASYYQNLLVEANRTISECQYTFEMLVINSAKDICCTAGIDAASFTVENYKIKCAGSYMINCTTGKLI